MGDSEKTRMEGPFLQPIENGKPLLLFQQLSTIHLIRQIDHRK
jgi:hypothetical protein